MNPHPIRPLSAGLAILLLSLVVAAPVHAHGKAGLPLDTELTLLYLDGNAMPPGVQVTLILGADGTAGGGSGCNSYSGGYQVADARLSFGPLASTLMACEEPAMSTEAEYHGVLGRIESWSWQEGRLVLHARDGATLVFEVSMSVDPGGTDGPGAELVGTLWSLEAIGQVSLSMPVQPEILLDGDGNLGGSSGCNRFFGQYALEGDRLTVGGLASTRVHCADPAVAEVERALLAMLSLPMRWHIDGELLMLSDEAGSLTITFGAIP